jgi:hypothetical protein
MRTDRTKVIAAVCSFANACTAMHRRSSVRGRGAESGLGAPGARIQRSGKRIFLNKKNTFCAQHFKLLSETKRSLINSCGFLNS